MSSSIRGRWLSFAASRRMDVRWPVLGARLTGLPVRQAIGGWTGRWVEAGLVGLAGKRGFLHGVVDFKDDAVGAIIAVILLLILAADDRKSIHYVGYGVARCREALLEPS